jgi:hypothetical protein
VTVATTKETYLPVLQNKVGACSGIITELYVPPGNLVSPLIAPMQKPYTVQTIIDTSLATTFASLPKYLSEECHFSIRKYLCSTNMLAPQVSVCHNYASNF